MAARLGYVLYWTGCVIAAIAVSFGGYAAAYAHESAGWIFGGALISVGLVSWLLGRAFRYVLAGN